jgi:hypothetical protein
MSDAIKSFQQEFYHAFADPDISPFFFATIALMQSLLFTYNYVHYININNLFLPLDIARRSDYRRFATSGQIFVRNKADNARRRIGPVSVA